MRIRSSRVSALQTFVFAALVTVGSAQARDGGIAPAKPELVGFSGERLQRLEKGMQQYIDDKQLAGMVTVLARHGRVVQQKAYGVQDVASNTPMKNDTIVRIYSMTKPVTGVALMMLYEEGKFRLTDPIARHIPEFKDLKVFAGVGADGKAILEAPKHAPTIGELMSHTAGFTYGLFGSSPVDKMYQASNPLGAANLQEMINKLAQLPLAYQPGEGWVYSVSVDVQGYLVEKISGKPLGTFMRERIFNPLGMKDTGFAVPADKLGRVATIYNAGPGGKLAPMPRDPNISQEPGLPQGGGGLYSTAGDYLRFTQMLLNGGELDGVRLLAPSTIELMRTNRVPDAIRDGKFGIGIYRQQPGLGFGLDFAILEDPQKLGNTAGKGSFLWDGIAGTWFWIDPSNDLIFIGMIQRWAPGASPNVEEVSRQLVYQALVDPAK